MFETLDKTTKYFAISCAIALSLFSLYTAFFGTFPTIAQRTIHLSAVGIVGIFLVGRSDVGRLKWGEMFADLLLMVMVISSNLYLYLYWEDFYINPYMTNMGMLMGIASVVSVLELTRRLVGIALPIIVMIFLLYTYFGAHIPGFLAHRGYGVERILVQIYTGTEGIYGIPLGVCATTVIVFVLFGSFLEKTGASEALLKLATSMAGGRRGGPAKVSIVASGFMGMLSGSSAANVATTGAITIPMMKKSGFDSHVAGAIEAVASSGGYKTPPIMGAVAFIMAEMLGASYIDVIVAAALPAFFHYFGLYIMVDLYAGRKGLKGLPKEQIPAAFAALRDGIWYLLPVFLLIVLMFERYTAMFACAYSMLLLWGIALVRGKLTLEAIYRALRSASQMMVIISIPSAAAGIVLGVLTLSGAGMKLSDLIVFLAGSSLFFTMFWIMVVSIILGMGLPPVVSYIVLAALQVPVLVELGVTPIAAHLFIFYFCSLSLITPPICTTSFTAAAIAGAPPMKTGFEAVRFGIVLYTLPYFFVYTPALLADGSLVDIVYACIIAALGIIALAIGAQGYFSRTLEWPVRVVFVVASIALFVPSTTITLFGFALFVATILFVKSNFLHSGYPPTETHSASSDAQTDAPTSLNNLTKKTKV